MRTARAFLVLVPLLAAASGLRAQEVQVAWDEGGRIPVIGTGLGLRLGLFALDYPGFEEARLFRLPAGDFVLEITTLQGGARIRHRIPLPAGEAEELRSRVQGLLAERAPGATRDHEGRNRLLGVTTGLGIGYYGWATPLALNVDDATAFGSLSLLIAGGSFLVPWWNTVDQPVSWGMQQGAAYGTTRGIAHGWALNFMLFGEVDSVQDTYCDSWGCYPMHDPNAEERFLRRAFGLSVITSIAEGIAGYSLARRHDLSGGHVATVGLGGDAGLVGGLLTAMILDTDNAHVAGGLVVAGSAVGLLGGARYAAARQHTMGDVGVMYLATGLAGRGGALVAELLELDDHRMRAALLLAGGLVGLGWGDNLVRETHFTTAQSSLMALGTLAGGLTGTGIALLLSGDEPSAKLMQTFGLAGAAAVFLPMYRRYAEEARAQPYMRGPGFRTTLVPTLVPASEPGGLAALPGLRFSVEF